MKDPLYIQLKTGTVASTEELIKGKVMLDLDESGDILGIEVITYQELRVDGVEIDTQNDV